ncbi:MAG: formyltransferase family protein [Patescibacteria group bacterium]
MKIAFYGGETAGVVALLTLLARKQNVVVIFPQDAKLNLIAEQFKLEQQDKLQLKNPQYIQKLSKKVDLIICCHGRLILPNELVSKVKSINLHPCLYKYKGLRPIRQLIADKNPRASVASHWMIEKIDAGQTIIEEFKKIENIQTKTEADIYNELYPIYVKVLIKTLEKINI